MGGGLLVAGTTSDAGKSVVTAGICRWLRRRGVRVAPFKAQNMSNNSAVVVDADGRGGEIGRAQAMQAAACGLAPSVRFNPVLLKPESDRRSQVIVLGEAIGHLGADEFAGNRARLRDAIADSLSGLRRDFDVVVCEGAGSPTEINLRAGDLANMGLAQPARLPTVVVGDIDRGGVFAALYGTVALLDADDQALISGFIVNKFRGDAGLLRPGIDRLTQLTGRPTLGVLPWHVDIWLDAEDSLAYGRVLGRPAPPLGTQWLRVAVIRLPRISNATDAEALASEPGVRVRLTVEAAELADADLVVLPGTKSTVDDLDWLRRNGLDRAIGAHVAAGKPVLGVCGGFQMLGTRIVDMVESGRGEVAGLGLLPIEVTFSPAKTVRRSVGTALGVPVRGYEIHHGHVSMSAPGLAPLITLADGSAEGAIGVPGATGLPGAVGGPGAAVGSGLAFGPGAAVGSGPVFGGGAVDRPGTVFGTHWHGAFESDEFRRAFLTVVARQAGRCGFAVAPNTQFSMVRERTLDLLGDLVEEHLDTDALWRLIEQGAPVGLPFIPAGHGFL